MAVSFSTLAASEFEGKIGLLEVKRPRVRNALDWEGMASFARTIEALYKKDELWALIVTGTKQAFVSGGDLKALSQDTSQADGLRLAALMGNALQRLEALAFPTIAAINGPARGGGAEIALACDLRVMGADADLGFVQVKLGLTPGWGAGQRLVRMVGYSRALEWLGTGRVLSAPEALQYGLANRLAPAGQALNAAQEFALELAAQPQGALRAIKRLLRVGITLPPETAASLERAEFPPLWAADEHLAAVRRFLEKRS
jgi:enoyl-CoA hydratase